ncbi:carboxymuconolactone decarboxylase [Mycolicibacterium thermoresistibile]|uniref:Carboxymuconolactone decarboxylase n=1 Tax=Mycolicibacterium thermoresistibile TaxID=1797 RepID=A0A100XEV2_MYCTH|nr:carboxymuconolactone decarboxylase [Mycolicibacterium thermoresistibile]
MILVSERRLVVRLAPLPAEQWDDEVLSALAVMLPEERRNPDGAGTALSTLVRHPRLTKAFLRFSNHLLFRSTLPPRLRELAVLRVAHRRSCDYEWAHHVFIGKAEGLTDDDIAGVQRGAVDDPFDQAVLDAVDELEEHYRISDATWATLGARLDERQLMDLVFTVGCYGLMAMAYNTFGITPETGR